MAIGDSKIYYNKHTEETPVHGTGQGSCASPAIWLMISSILMDCLSELAGGMTMEDVGNEVTLCQWMDGFIDDTSLFANLWGQEEPNDITLLRQQLREDLLAWKDLLEALGGKLELSKCFYCILSWRFDDNGNAIPTTLEEQRKICPSI
jgi:hypothetical protein